MEKRARDILGLEDPDRRFLSMRVEHLWRAEGFASVVPFNGTIIAPMGPSLDLGILRESLESVMRRHDVLHTRLALDGERPIQIVEDVKTPDLDVVDVPRAELLAHREGAEAPALREFVATPIDLKAETAFRCRVFRDEDQNYTLGILLHHYFGDGWSSQILRREISAAYAAIALGQAPKFGETQSYAEYALSQRQSLSKTLTRQLDYWRQRLENASACKLPYDHVRDTNKMGRFYFGIDEGLTGRLAEISKSQHVSPFVIYLAALQILLAGWAGAKSAITAVNTADRIKPQFQNTVGYLITSVPVFTEMAEDWSVADMLPAVARNFYDAYAHRDLSYDLYDLVAEPPHPFCTTLFNFIPLQEKLSAARSQPAFQPLQGVVGGPSIQRVRVHREIYFCLVELPQGMVGKIYYNLDFFEPKTIEALIMRYYGILGKMAANPKSRVAELL
jgi:hypothetical protein